jgi:hypothetical protein
MNSAAIRRLARDFLEWNGKMPPDSEHAVTVYIDYACPVGINPSEAWQVLNQWLNRNGMNMRERKLYGLDAVRGNAPRT